MDQLLSAGFRFIGKVFEFASIAIKHPSYPGLGKRWGLFIILVLLYWKSKFSPNQAVSQKLWNYKVVGDSPQSFFFLFWEIFILEIYSFNSKNSSPKIIDAGANIGLSVCYFKMLYPEAEILAFEPLAQAFSYLEKNIRENGFEQVQAIQVALSDQEGNASLWIDEHAPLYNATLFPNTKTGRTEEITTCRFSRFLEKSTFDLIKLDIEGAEQLVIEDLIDAGLLRNSKNYILEYHQSKAINHNYDKFVKGFQKAGYTLSKRNLSSQEFPEDEILFFSIE